MKTSALNNRGIMNIALISGAKIVEPISMRLLWMENTDSRKIWSLLNN